MNVTLRVFFRNIMLFIQHSKGTDVWLVAGHKAHVSVAEYIRPLDKRVVRILSNDKELEPAMRTTFEGANLIPNFKALHPTLKLHDDIINNVVSETRLARVEIRGSGTLRALPSWHSHLGMKEWTIQKANGESLKHLMTELVIYEAKNVATPITLSLKGAETEILPVKITKDEKGNDVADVFVMAGDKPERRDVGDEYEIKEYINLNVCFDPDSADKLKHSIPKAKKPNGAAADLLTADPFCPDGRVEV